jgi:hypothetical protein
MKENVKKFQSVEDHEFVYPVLGTVGSQRLVEFYVDK